MKKIQQTKVINTLKSSSNLPIIDISPVQKRNSNDKSYTGSIVNIPPTIEGLALKQIGDLPAKKSVKMAKNCGFRIGLNKFTRNASVIGPHGKLVQNKQWDISAYEKTPINNIYELWQYFDWTRNGSEDYYSKSGYSLMVDAENVTPIWENNEGELSIEFGIITGTKIFELLSMALQEQSLFTGLSCPNILCKDINCENVECFKTRYINGITCTRKVYYVEGNTGKNVPKLLVKIMFGKIIKKGDIINNGVIVNQELYDLIMKSKNNDLDVTPQDLNLLHIQLLKKQKFIFRKKINQEKLEIAKKELAEFKKFCNDETLIKLSDIYTTAKERAEKTKELEDNVNGLEIIINKLSEYDPIIEEFINAGCVFSLTKIKTKKSEEKIKMEKNRIYPNKKFTGKGDFKKNSSVKKKYDNKNTYGKKNTRYNKK